MSTAALYPYVVWACQRSYMAMDAEDWNWIGMSAVMLLLISQPLVAKVSVCPDPD